MPNYVKIARREAAERQRLILEKILFGDGPASTNETTKYENYDSPTDEILTDDERVRLRKLALKIDESQRALAAMNEKTHKPEKIRLAREQLESLEVDFCYDMRARYGLIDNLKRTYTWTDQGVTATIIESTVNAEGYDPSHPFIVQIT